MPKNETKYRSFFDKADNLVGYRGVDKDITDRKTTEKELAKYRGQLERLVEERTSQLKEAQVSFFTYRSSHHKTRSHRAICQ